jgi:hypothetical protein
MDVLVISLIVCSFFRGNIAVYSIKTYADDVTSRDFSLELQQTTRSTIHDYAQ